MVTRKVWSWRIAKSKLLKNTVCFERRNDNLGHLCTAVHSISVKLFIKMLE